MIKKTILIFMAVLAISGTALAQIDAEIRATMIAESISSYSGNCPCPYNRASNGSRCGGRSAYSRAGGYSPLCFDKDISDEMVQQYRKDNNL